MDFLMEHHSAVTVGDSESTVGVLLILQLVKKSMTKNQKKDSFLKNLSPSTIPVTISEQVPTVRTRLGWLPFSAWHGHQ